MTKQVITEKFSWLAREAFQDIADVGKNTVAIKGIAACAGTSRNLRQYVDEELKRAARTWRRKPLTINHDPKRIVGHVEWMEYENGCLEYLAVVKKQPYVDMLRNKDPRIRGVSIEAEYLYNRCPKCGEKFYTEEQFRNHMREVHLIKNGITQPHGIVGTYLSLVVAPEVPGVEGTTVDFASELMETLGYKDFSQLLETVTHDVKEKIEWREKMKKAKAPTISKQQSITVDQARKLAEQQKCPEGEKWDEEQGKCVPVSEEQEDIKPGSHYCEEHPDDPRCIAHKKAIHGEEILEADYPWDQCVRDRMSDGYTEEQAKKICAAIKNRTIKHTMEFYGYKTVQEAIRHVAKKIEEDKLFAYNLERAAEQLQQGPPPEPTVKPPAPCPEGFVLKDGECVPKEWPEISPTAKTPAPQMTPEPTIGEQDEGKLPPAPFPEPPPAPEEHHCPEGSHYDAEAGTCVPDETIPTEVSDLVREIKLLPKLAEPGDVPHADWSKAGYTSFDDCVSKNQDKGDPEAYCADIRRKLIGESLKETFNPEKTYIRLSRVEEKLGKLIETRNSDVDAVAKLTQIVARLPAALHSQRIVESRIRSDADRKLTRYVRETLSTMNRNTKKYLSSLATTMNKQCSSLSEIRENLGALEKAYEELAKWRKDFDNVLKGLDSKVVAELKTLGEQVKEKDAKIAELEAKLKEKVEKTVKETAEIRTELDNFKSKLKGNFKGHNPIVVKETADVTIGDPAKEMRETARKKRR
ncbi:MAG: hypothetical protein DRJ03_04050 [Chloroflexi bacterium]|nr:MAG: hypothetical protein DRJ03_04050 [Chloroflexota bacterium]